MAMMTPAEIEATFQELYDEALEIQRAARANGQALGEAGRSLNAASTKLTQRLEQLAKDVTGIVENSSECTATKTAALLREKFTEADQHALAAADIYRRAADHLRWRALAMIVLAQAVLIAFVLWLVQVTIPSPSAIQEREQIIKQGDRRIEEQQQQLGALERRGAALDVRTCRDERKSRYPCVATDETVVKDAFIDPSTHQTYRAVRRR